MTDEAKKTAANAIPEEARLLRKAVRRGFKRARRKAGKLQDDLAQTEKAEAYRREGELLKASLGTLKRGQEEAIVPDFYTDAAGAMATIALDPARPPRETMEKLFRRAAKLERGRPHVQASIETNRQTIRKLEALLQEIEEWCEACKAAEEAPGAIPQEWIERSRALHVAPQELESIAPAPPPRSKKEERDDALRKGVRSFRSRDGWEILVGKSARDNDALTFRLARGNDWWFHLAPAAGSHVVARNPDGGRELPQETLLDAAHLAVHFSKMRNTDRADVTYAQAKHVRRIKGAPPGKVQVERPKTIFVRIEPARMERLTRGTR